MHTPIHTHSKQEHEGVEPICTLRAVEEIFSLGGKKSHHAKNKVSNLCLKNVDFLGATPKVYLIATHAHDDLKYIATLSVSITFYTKLGMITSFLHF